MPDFKMSTSVDDLLLAAADSGSTTYETGRYIITFKEDAGESGLQMLRAQSGFRVADARDFSDQAAVLGSMGDADSVYLPELGVALVGGEAFQSRSLSAAGDTDPLSPVASMDPEYFMFALGVDPNQYLRGFKDATDAINKGLMGAQPAEEQEEEFSPEVLGVTWGLQACKVPPSNFSGVGIKVAILDTGFALNHPDFVGRPIVSQSFVGQPVQDLNGHGTHCTGTACGPKAPAGTTPRYGIAFNARIHIGKVLSNTGGGTMAGVLAGMNWAIAQKCEVISMSLGAPIGVQPAYTAAGNAALANKLLIVAAAGNSGGPTGAPANSPSIFSVAALTQSLQPAVFSSNGKVEIAAPGVDVFSSWLMPLRYRTISGTSMATPHVAGCAALWAQSNASLRGITLWNKLRASARALPFPPTRVGRGLVQAP